MADSENPDSSETAANGDRCDHNWKRLTKPKTKGGINANQRCTKCKAERWQP